MIDPKTWAESGVLLVDKPVDWTSHDVVNCVRSRFRVRKVGHCGTLDPSATGLLVLVLGKATKLSARLSGQDKTYAGTMRLGIETSSQDRDGEITATCDASHVTVEEVRSAAEGFVGDIMQIPPMVSAVKKDGQRLYKLARRGETVERDPRPVTIHYLRLGEVELPDICFEVSCTKGTYVRTLCADLGAALGVGAHLLGLRRIRSGDFDVADATPIEEIKEWDRDRLLASIIPLPGVLGLI